LGRAELRQKNTAAISHPRQSQPNPFTVHTNHKAKLEKGSKRQSMILKTLTLVSGMFGAAIFSQFPEFTQQYMQRMGGQIDALGVVLHDFDASAD
jgi:hypothetical protein